MRLHFSSTCETTREIAYFGIEKLPPSSLTDYKLVLL